MTAQPCLMQVHAHPDDEASKGAPLAARYASTGVRTVLVTCTGGEAGEILNPAADTPEARADLPAMRLRELQASVAAIGYAASHLLGYRDSGMPDTPPNAHPDAFANAALDESVGRLVRIVRAERPQVIVCYEEDQSLYPHPDHIRSWEVTAAAFDAAADGSRYPDAGEPWQPAKLYYFTWCVAQFRALHEACERLGVTSWFGKRLDALDPARDDRITTRVDVGAWIHARSAALRAHATQIAPDSFWFALPDEVLTDAWPWENLILARSHVGMPAPGEIETDVFARIG